MPEAGGERDEWQMTTNGYGFFGGDNKNVIKLGSGNGFTALNILKISVHFKGWIFLYINYISIKRLLKNYTEEKITRKQGLD